MKNRKRTKAAPKAKPDQFAYLDIYIEQDGSMILNHLTPASLPFLENFSQVKKEGFNLYCG